MMHNFNVNSQQIDKIKKITNEEKNFRIKNLQLFELAGLPNKRLEDWKFSDFKEIVSKNFDELDTKFFQSDVVEINLLKEFEHNYILLVNGTLNSSNFDFEEKEKIKINAYHNSDIYQTTENPLVCLNHALAENGYSLEVEKNYKFKKNLVIYNYFTKDLKNKILNNKNSIKINENAEVHIIEYTINESTFKFISNIYESIFLYKNAKLKSLCIQNNKSNGFFHKHLKCDLLYNSDLSNLIFSSGLKFNKIDIECNMKEENSSCNILSALFLNKGEHHEIKTLINHLAPNCKSFQTVKKVLNQDSKGIFQGKIYVKDIAQKTDSYQLSKALMLGENAEFNSKPELEIYADDVKCSHGSASGSIDDDSLHYLMTRGLNRNQAVNLMVKGFLNEIVEFIKSPSIKNFVQSKMEDQING